jgi:hypothetical protein
MCEAITGQHRIAQLHHSLFPPCSPPRYVNLLHFMSATDFFYSPFPFFLFSVQLAEGYNVSSFDLLLCFFGG